MQNTMLSQLEPVQNLSFIEINGQPISFKQSLKYLQTAGKFQTVIREIAQQYVLEQEIQAMGISAPSTEMIEQFILEFRLQQQLTSPEQFQIWLAANGIGYTDFRQQVNFRLQQEELKKKVVTPQLQKYFDQQKNNLDRLVLARIVVEQSQQAEELQHRLEQGEDFSQLAKQYSVVDDAVVGGAMGPVIRGQMPEVIRQATESAIAGQIVGPLKIDDRCCLLKIEQLLPAVLEDALKRDLEEHLFQRWLTEKLQQMTVNLVASEINSSKQETQL